MPLATTSNESGLRAWLNRNPMIMILVALAVVALAVGMVWQSLAPPDTTPRGVYYYDLAQRELFVAPASQLTPIVRTVADDADINGGSNADTSEATGVLAVVFACGDCGDQAGQFIGWLEMHNPERVNHARGPDGQVTGMTLMTLEERPDGTLIATPDDPDTWIPRGTPAGRELMSQRRQTCEDAAILRCQP